jgi:hypothetical protein
MADLTGVDIAACLNYWGYSGKSRMTDSYENMSKFWEDTTTTCPTEDEIAVAWTTVEKNQKIDALDAEYEPQFIALTQAYATALTAGDTTTATARQAEYTTLKAAYTTALAAIS